MLRRLRLIAYLLVAVWLALIVPVGVDIVAVYLFLDRLGLPGALVALALDVYLAWSHGKAYRPMLAAR